jgi:hypothetical protein
LEHYPELDATIRSAALYNEVVPPWILVTPETKTYLADNKDKYADPVLLKTTSELYIREQRADRLVVFTEESKCENGQLGIGMVFPSWNIKSNFSVTAGVSIFTAELHCVDSCSYQYIWQCVCWPGGQKTSYKLRFDSGGTM